MLKCENICFSVGGRLLVKDLSFTLSQGQTLGFLGPNGAGKTTSIKMLSTALQPSTGVIYWNNQDMLSSVSKAQGLVGYMPESPPLYAELRVVEYITLFAHLRNVSANAIKSEVKSVIEACRLTEVASTFCRVLSKGFQQKVSLAAALVGSPPLLLLDEPTSGLDPREIVEIRKLIASLRQRHTIIVSSHILSEVQELCDVVLMLVAGEKKFFKTMEAVTTDGSLEQSFLSALTGEC